MIVESQIVNVQPDQWLTTAEEYRNTGLSSLDWLTAVDRSTQLEVLAHLVVPGTGTEVLVRTQIPSASPHLASLVSVFPGADWHERETSEMFGIEFTGRPSTEPLLLRSNPERPPMRRTTPLPERMETRWPGATEEREGRRRRLAPGVREEWSGDDG